MVMEKVTASYAIRYMHLDERFLYTALKYCSNYKRQLADGTWRTGGMWLLLSGGNVQKFQWERIK